MADPSSPIAATRRLIHHTRSGVLTTILPDGGGGVPFASLVTPAATPDLSPLLRLSRLARHTQNLTADLCWALFLAGLAPGPCPGPRSAGRARVSLLSTAAPLNDAPALAARWLAPHPSVLWWNAVTEPHWSAAWVQSPACSLRTSFPIRRGGGDCRCGARDPSSCNAERADALDVVAGATDGTNHPTPNLDGGFMLISIAATSPEAVPHSGSILSPHWPRPGEGTGRTRASYLPRARGRSSWMIRWCEPRCVSACPRQAQRAPLRRCLPMPRWPSPRRRTGSRKIRH